MCIYIYIYIAESATKNTARLNQRPKTSKGRTTTKSQQGQISQQQPAMEN